MVTYPMGSISKQSWLDLFKQNAVQKDYSLNAIIDFQGRSSDSVGLVISGRIEAVVFSENGDEVWIAEFSEGEFIGHMSFLNEATSQFELVAKSDVCLARIPAQKLRNLIHIEEPLREALIQDFARRLDITSQNLVNAYTLSAKGRICAELIRLSREIGIAPDKFIIRPNPVCVELARRVNSTRETVSRTVSDLQKMGILSREPGALIIHNPKKLETVYK